MQALKGKKLAFVQTGCNDAGFVDNAMLESEVDPTFFGARGGEKDLTGALASVTSYKTAQAVFAPVGSAKGLTKVFDTGSVPNPAFVEVAGKVPAAITPRSPRPSGAAFFFFLWWGGGSLSVCVCVCVSISIYIYIYLSMCVCVCVDGCMCRMAAGAAISG